MGQVSREQALEVMAKLGTKADWSRLDSDALQRSVVEDPNSGREFTRFLANRGRVQIVTTGGIVAPQGGKILIVTVPVGESRLWEDAVSAAGPNTGRGCDIWKVGDQYLPMAGATPGLQQIFLANFGKFTRSEGNLIWAKDQHLVPASPRAVFAIGEHCSYLNLAMDPMTVVSLVPCSFGGGQCVCYGWRSGSARRASLSWFEGAWYADCWFAFVRE